MLFENEWMTPEFVAEIKTEADNRAEYLGQYLEDCAKLLKIIAEESIAQTLRFCADENDTGRFTIVGDKPRQSVFKSGLEIQLEISSKKKWRSKFP